MAQQKCNITNWKAYNNALITRGSLTCWGDETALHAWYCEATPSLRGRPPHYSDMVITSVLMLKWIFGLTLRALQGFVDSIVTLIKVPLN
ncbi:MAG: IS5/IS1182 family transposase, partial [Serratia symbiotica]|nr:IS5/IS1182 family transposase [Serratia symbiotica]